MTGFINIDKAEGVSSAREVAQVKRLTGMPCGHMGTLDPMASGVLPVAVGNACRLFDYFLTKEKKYVADFRFGEEYDTLDITGTLLASGGRIPTESELSAIIPALTGEIMQVPPKYSAKSVNGKRGYQLARSGEDFTLPPKKVKISAIKLLERKDENTFSFEIECGGGTYIRSIVRDMAAMLQTIGCMSALKRVASGPFKIENSVKTEALTKENIQKFFIPCDSVIALKEIHANGAQWRKLSNGVAINCDIEDGLYKIYDDREVFYGLAEVKCERLKVRTKLC